MSYWGYFFSLSHGRQISPFPHEFIGLKKRLGHDEVTQLLDRPFNMFLPVFQNKDTMAREQEIGPKLSQLLNVGAIIRQVAPLGVHKSHLAAVKDHITREQPSLPVALIIK